MLSALAGTLATRTASTNQRYDEYLTAVLTDLVQVRCLSASSTYRLFYRFPRRSSTDRENCGIIAGVVKPDENKADKTIADRTGADGPSANSARGDGFGTHGKSADGKRADRVGANESIADIIKSAVIDSIVVKETSDDRLHVKNALGKSSFLRRFCT